MQHTRQLIREVLSQLSSSHEAQYYLEQYNVNDEMRFAVIKVGGGIIHERLDDLCAALSVLRHLGLHPILIHGAGPQLDQAINAAGISSNKVDGFRVTSEAVMEVVRPTIYKVNRDLVNTLEKHQVRAVGMQHGVFTCDYDDKERYGLVGKIKHINLDSIRDAIEADLLPVISSLGETSSGQVVNINADVAARELVWAISPSKIIFITPTGGLLDEDNKLISAISLKNDYANLMQADWVHSGMRLKLEQIHDLLKPLPANASVSITSVDHLVRELFTHRGAGTLINQGENIQVLTQLNKQQESELTSLIESAFARSLKDDYFKQHEIHKVLISESGGAAAVVVTGFNGVPYLDKFAVTPEARGKGYAAALWRALKKECPQLYWRSRKSNAFTPWYYHKSDFSMKNQQWVSFSYGVKDFDYLHDCVNDAFQRCSAWKDSMQVVRT
ncbi:MAG: acetylglutamate kinase [Gammaproteobacteria bacterium]|nr:acetylglutamate kinase [Gammaproteobacteria bacterium]NNC98096.1 acetylglutamate kinase [Gammaproteobacteria bacterium]NNM13160.1 acetylglutamate kinase [Gammaproteobacteria bacterium]